jgi:branched-chain amino acid transport system permease protein
MAALNYYLTVLSLIAISGLLGLSVYLVLSTGQLTLGNAGFMAIGAYTSALMATKLNLPAYVTIPAGALLAAVVSVPLGYLCLRLRGVYLAIATLGFTQSVMVIAVNSEWAGGALGIKNIPNLNKALERAMRAAMEEAPFGLSFTQAANLGIFLLLLLVLALAVAFVYLQGSSRVGRAYTAIRTDEVAASAMGIDTTYYKVLAFAQGALLAGLAGGLHAHTTFAISPPEFGFARAVEMLAYVVVGGSFVPLGPALGAGVLIALSEGLRDFELFGAKMADYRLIIYGALMMLMMTLRPQGLLTPGLLSNLRRRLGKGATA